MKATARILNGIEIAAQIKAEVAEEARALAAGGITPGLAVVLVGHVAASEIYVRSKVKTCAELGIWSEMLTPPESVTTEEMLELIAGLNARDEVDGILIQLPLPAHVDTRRLLEAVSPEKDVDGFHPINVGRLQSSRPWSAGRNGAGAMHAGGDHGDSEAQRSAGGGAARGGAGAVGDCGQAGGDDAAERVGDGDGVPQQDGGDRPLHARRGHSGGGDRQAGICDARRW